MPKVVSFDNLFFSSNMNRIQMIVNSAVMAGRRVALDGRSMMSYAEIAVRQGI